MDYAVNVRPAKSGEEILMNEFWAGVNGDLSMYDYYAYMKLDPDYLMVAADKNDQPVGESLDNHFLPCLRDVDSNDNVFFKCAL